MASTNLEQLVLELINDARLDPLGNAARYITSYSPLTATQANIQNNFNFFNVNGPALQTAFAALAAKQPLAWNDNLANAARLHDNGMIAVNQQTHDSVGNDPAGQPGTDDDLAARFNGAGYTGWTAIAENIFAAGQDALHIHSGFMVDWGNGPNGMQNPPGHRNSIMGIGQFNSTLREVGVGIVQTAVQSNVGPLAVTQDFGVRSTAGVFLLGVAYNDTDNNKFYSMGEGLGTLSVSVGAANTTSFASGGYVLQTAATGAQTVNFSGAGLVGTGTFATTFANGQNIKFDVVGGNTLNTSASGTVGGAFTSVRGLGIIGLTLTTGAGDQTLIGTKGSDTLNGGTGIDTAVYAGNQASYTITKNVGSVTVSGPEGTDTLTGIERVQFANGTVPVQKSVANDFNGDSKSDVLFHSTNSDYAWLMNDRAIGGQGGVDLFDSNFSVQVTGDFDGDGKSDVIFERPSTGGVYQWLLDGTTIKSQGAVDVADSSYHLLGTADFNGDGKSDLLWRNDAGFIYQWQMNGKVDTPVAVGPLSPAWHVVGAGDFTGDGKADILLRNISGTAENGAYFLWTMNGATIAAQGGIERPGTDWKTLGIGDFDGDGKADFAVRNQTNGAVWIYLMNGTAIKDQGGAGIADAATWHLQTIGDFNGDGRDDILFRNNAGYFYSWDMNGKTIQSEGLFGTQAGNWADPNLHVVTQHWDLV